MYYIPLYIASIFFLGALFKDQEEMYAEAAMKKPSSAKTFAIVLAAVAVLGSLATTCAKLDIARRRFQHDVRTRREALEFERLKFDHSKERLALERDRLDNRKATLTDSIRKKWEHEIIKISSKRGNVIEKPFTHVDASVLVQSMFDDFLSIESTRD